jgi:hypothetical protein
MKGEISVLFKIIISVFLILIISLITFFYFKNQPVEITKTIAEEIDLKQKIGEGLLDLRATLKSDKPDDLKIRESLNIINNIKGLIDSEYQSLRKEAQEGADRIKERLDKIAQIIPISIDEAIKLVDSLIDDLEDSENIGTFGQKNDKNETIIFNNNNSNPNNDNKVEIQQNPTTNNTNVPPTTNQNNDTIPNDPNSPFEYVRYKQGVRPQVDRDSSNEIEGETIPVGTKIGN